MTVSALRKPPVTGLSLQRSRSVRARAADLHRRTSEKLSSGIRIRSAEAL
jgi:hypothetical protein